MKHHIDRSPEMCQVRKQVLKSRSELDGKGIAVLPP